ncbi:MAG: sigma-70 family RNA polymerase sigma factor [Chloroflexota bacterium]
MELNEGILIHCARHGDIDAFEQLVARYTPKLYRVVQRMAANTSQAEDITQEAFLRVWQTLSRFQEDADFFPYLAKIATNLLYDEWRRSKRYVFNQLENIDETMSVTTPTPEQVAENAERRKILVQAVCALPPAYRTVIALRYDAEMSYQQIAETLDIPLNTVRTHLHRAKAYLQKFLEERLNDG